MNAENPLLTPLQRLGSLSVRDLIQVRASLPACLRAQLVECWKAARSV